MDEDGIRARLERIENDCVMPDRYRGEEYALELTKALYAVLDLADHFERHYGPSLGSEIRHAVAAALGVQRATPPASSENSHEFMAARHDPDRCGRTGTHIVWPYAFCGRLADDPLHQQRPTPPAGFTPLSCDAEARDGRVCRWTKHSGEHSWVRDLAERGNNTEGER